MDFCKFFQRLLLTFTLIQSTVSGQELMHICSMSENYSCSDPYETSLNALLSHLKNEAPFTGFAVGSKGEGQNRTYGLALCRGDLSPTDCGNCIVQAINDMLKVCPHNKGAMVLHEDCTVEYSKEDSNFSQTMHNSMVCLTSQNNVSDPNSKFFNQKTQEFLSKISEEAMLDPDMYAAGKLQIDEYNTVYGYAQCNRDLASIDCNECLNKSLAYLKTCGEEKEGVRVYNGVCRIRYEIYPFLNDEHSYTPPFISFTPDANSPYPQPEDGSALGFEPKTLIVIGLLSLLLTHYVIQYV